jgi:hypothetical protein
MLGQLVLNVWCVAVRWPRPRSAWMRGGFALVVACRDVVRIVACCFVSNIHVFVVLCNLAYDEHTKHFQICHRGAVKWAIA